MPMRDSAPPQISAGEQLSELERQELLRLARAAIVAASNRAPLPGCEASGRLGERRNRRRPGPIGRRDCGWTR